MAASSGSPASFDVVIVGGGPRGVATVLRLAARVGADAPPVRVAIVDAVEIGAGATWRTDQPAAYLNNTTAAATTIHPDESTPMSGPAAPGPDLVAWAAQIVAAGEHPMGVWVVDEAATLHGDDFPTRRLQGAYFRDQLDGAIASGRVLVDETIGLAIDVRSHDDGATVVLEDGRELSAPTVVLAQGMVQAQPTTEVAALAAFAERHGLAYVGPGMPGEQDWSLVPSAATGSEPPVVLVRGLGATFFDVVGDLVSRWGGSFEPVPRDPHGRLRYVPSGREPRLVAGSGRGLPYRAKPDGGLVAPGTPRYATPERFARWEASTGFDLRRDVWPVLARDFAFAHLDALARARPDAVAPGWLDALDAATDLPSIERVLGEWILDERELWHVDWLRRPTRGTPVDADAWAEIVQRHVDDELASMAESATSPRAAVNRMMQALRGQVVRLALRGALTGKSAVHDVFGWFDGDGLFLASGPPAGRTREVLALIEAGVLDLLGPELTIERDEAAGRFVATSPISGRSESASVLVETRMSKGRVGSTSDPLLQSLLARGAARLHAFSGVQGDGLDTSPAEVDEASPSGHNLVAADGTADPAVVVLGIPASTTQPGSAIGATPGKPSPLLAGADVAAKQVLLRRGSD